ncbi:MAG TPA: GNAT family N-acetyltransferase [Blastocatellia bacterium]|nr:GNAT family N-acetyltransferase [Blastocatellia bacterium]
MLSVDAELARRLEMTDALAGVEFARAWARRHSYSEEVAIEVAGGHAGFAGVDSPLTQAFALGFNGPVRAADLERMEHFYQSRGSAVNVETCPLADPSLLELLGQRGYRQIEESNVFAREIVERESNLWPDDSSGIRVRSPEERELDTYTELVAKSFFENVEITPEFLDLFKNPFYAAGAHFFMAEVEGVPAGGAMMSIHRGVASLGGAGTLPEFRNRGVQTALILARLEVAAESGCDLAMVATGLDTVSQRNVERRGFQMVYRRSKLIREWR